MGVENKAEDNQKILLIIGNDVVDSSVIHQLLKTNGRSSSFALIETTSFKDVSKLMRASRPDCCIVGYQEPIADVLNFLKSLRRSKINSDIPVIVLANRDNGDVRSVVEIMHHGAQDYLIKEELTENILRRSIADAIYTCEFQKNLRQLAHYDHLTGLLNRSLFIDRLENTVNHCDRYNQNCSLLYIDVDNFKVINDCYGHDAGDVLLKTIAKRIQENCRTTDSASRIGGDEFAIIISRVDKDRANHTAEKILEKVSEPVFIDSQRLHVSLSIGIAHYPDTAGNINELMDQADQAMYRAKQTGKARYFQFSQNQKLQLDRRSRLEDMLPEALENNELELFFQPSVNVEDQSLYSLSVIVVWSPGRYKVSDMELKEMIDHLGLYDNYYKWLINTSMARLCQWQQNHSDNLVNINIPIDHCNNEWLVDYFRHCAKNYRIQLDQIEMEVSEKVIMKDIVQSRKFLKAIQNMGARVSIDGFSGGYISVDDLILLSLSTLVIDQSYCVDVEKNPQKYKAVEAITLLAHTLGLKVVIKNVDMEARYDVVKNIACDIVQGNYILESKSSLSDCEPYISAPTQFSEVSQ